MQPFRSYNGAARGRTLTAVVYKGRRPRYYPKEHREAKHLTAQQVADRLGIHEKSVFRVEKEPWRLDRKAKRDQWAEALGLESGEELERLPNVQKRRSLDALTRDQPDEIHQMAFDIVSRLISGGRQ